jgi:hypothetical protein
MHHLKVFSKYIQLSKLVENCKIHKLKKKYTRWRHSGLITILNYQLSKISYIISRHSRNVFINLNRLKNAKTIGQKRKCTKWRHLRLTAILKRQTSEISYIISRHFQNVFSFKNRLETAKVIKQTQNFSTTRHLELIHHLFFLLKFCFHDFLIDIQLIIF